MSPQRFRGVMSLTERSCIPHSAFDIPGHRGGEPEHGEPIRAIREDNGLGIGARMSGMPARGCHDAR